MPDSVSAEDIFYMRRCFDLARQGRPLVKTNPLVGCCIVHKGRIIGEGYHHIFGQHHAEIDAINQVEKSDLNYLSDSTLYVSLAPCNHLGKTPACTEKILELSIPRVVIGMDEINPIASGGIKRLRDAGVIVETGVLAEQAVDLIHAFKLGVQQNRPYVTLKWAQSADGFIGQEGKEIPISTTISKLKVHDLRRQNNAILIGGGTAITDNPQLTTRVIPGANPLRVIISGDREIPAEATIMTDQHDTVIFSTRPYTYMPKPGNKKIVTLDKIDLKSLLATIYDSYQVGWLLVEGGANILNQFIDQKLWDESWRITSAKCLSSGIEAPSMDERINETFYLGSDRFDIMHPTFD